MQMMTRPKLTLPKQAATKSASMRAKPDRKGSLLIGAAPDGPPISADLPEAARRKITEGRKLLTPVQLEILNRVISKAGEGDPQTLGLRLVLAASQDELAAAWPIGMFQAALSFAGRVDESRAVHGVMVGCRVSRWGEMAAGALAILEQRLSSEKAAEKEPRGP
jgi:hypothetical protein